ncbi:MAG: hypothetical protein ACYS7M_00290, partial [Planctomycetota bacterium]
MRARQRRARLLTRKIHNHCHEAYADESETEADANQPRFATLMAFAEAEHDIPWHRVTTNPE